LAKNTSSQGKNMRQVEGMGVKGNEATEIRDTQATPPFKDKEVYTTKLIKIHYFFLSSSGIKPTQDGWGKGPVPTWVGWFDWVLLQEKEGKDAQGKDYEPRSGLGLLSIKEEVCSPFAWPSSTPPPQWWSRPGQPHEEEFAPPRYVHSAPPLFHFLVDGPTWWVASKIPPAGMFSFFPFLGKCPPLSMVMYGICTR
jgi:hypothetical protein